MKQYVKVKVVSLGDETKYIRKEERKRLDAASRARTLGRIKSEDYHNANYIGMRDHRICVIRPEARAANIAYGFLRGKKYVEIERLSYTQPNWSRVRAIVQAHAEGDKAEVMERFAKWLQDALGGQPEAEKGGYRTEFMYKYNPFYRPSSIKEIESPWVLRMFQGDKAAFLNYQREMFPLKPRKPYVRALES